jgi:hypothetical protein
MNQIRSDWAKSDLGMPLGLSGALLAGWRVSIHRRVGGGNHHGAFDWAGWFGGVAVVAAMGNVSVDH